MVQRGGIPGASPPDAACADASIIQQRRKEGNVEGEGDVGTLAFNRSFMLAALTCSQDMLMAPSLNNVIEPVWHSE